MNLCGLKRDSIDKFYTNPKIVKQCIYHIKDFLEIKSTDLCIEPSAGNGAFINGIKQLTEHYKFYDLKPEHSDIKSQDYLSLDTSKYTQYKKIHVIGNPPFGRHASLARKFIKKSSLFCDSISFILPKSFKKSSFQKTFPLNFHLIFELDLPKDSFLINNVKYDVPCVFQIWLKKDFDRKVLPKPIPKNYLFVKKNENPDISFRRVGVYAGKIDTKIKDKSPQSHYFIVFNEKKDLTTIIKKLENIKFKTDNTVGPKSISKPELITEFNKIVL